MKRILTSIQLLLVLILASWLAILYCDHRYNSRILRSEDSAVVWTSAFFVGWAIVAIIAFIKNPKLW